MSDMRDDGPIPLIGGMFDGATIRMSADHTELSIEDDQGHVETYTLEEGFDDTGRVLCWRCQTEEPAIVGELHDYLTSLDPPVTPFMERIKREDWDA